MREQRIWCIKVFITGIFLYAFFKNAKLPLLQVCWLVLPKVSGNQTFDLKFSFIDFRQAICSLFLFSLSLFFPIFLYYFSEKGRESKASNFNHMMIEKSEL